MYLSPPELNFTHQKLSVRYSVSSKYKTERYYRYLLHSKAHSSPTRKWPPPAPHRSNLYITSQPSVWIEFVRIREHLGISMERIRLTANSGSRRNNIAINSRIIITSTRL